MTLELYYYDECPYCQIVLQAIDQTKLRDKITFKNTRKDPKNREKLVADTGPMHQSRDIANWLKANASKLA